MAEASKSTHISLYQMESFYHRTWNTCPLRRLEQVLMTMIDSDMLLHALDGYIDAVTGEKIRYSYSKGAEKGFRTSKEAVLMLVDFEDRKQALADMYVKRED